MKFYNICSKHSYKTNDGKEKTIWPRVGTLKETDDGKRFITLNLMPNESFYVFEQEAKPENQANKETESVINYDDENRADDVIVENIPF